MIDEKKLIEKIEERRRYWENCAAEYDEAGYDINMDICDSKAIELQTIIKHINEQPKVGEWIPVAERLPEESLNSVLAWDEYRNRCVFAQYYGGYWHLKDEIIKITAWQPLPEPYRGDTNDSCVNCLWFRDNYRMANKVCDGRKKICHNFMREE